MTPLHVAAAWPWSDHLRLLLSLGADPDRQDAAGRTPLHITCREEWQWEIRALVWGRTTAAAERVEGKDKLIKPAGEGGGVVVEDVRALVDAGAQVRRMGWVVGQCSPSIQESLWQVKHEGAAATTSTHVCGGSRMCVLLPS